MNSIEMIQDVLAGYLILVVDDAQDNVEVMQEYFELNGAEVITALNGREGLEMASHRPDLIILDLAMPVMTGFEMLIAMQDDRAMAEIPVIVLTGHALDSYRTAAFEAGGHYFMVKPVRPEVLVNRMVEVLTDTIMETG